MVDKSTYTVLQHFYEINPQVGIYLQHSAIDILYFNKFILKSKYKIIFVSKS